ncbi:hypothetical protein [Alteromonas gilva]|uniref:Uncharacterized protein n=1 Tax=Alteromonas gilva TaxID=2987522 RepID=A0ABT5L787_9ALTE|nr:hypothetical protein [Alteromonas gilva]MDC8832915.1 hypothetical protein [Alteromonas gilva]
MPTVEQVIKALKGNEPYVESIFLRGGCYQFHLFLRTIFPAALPLISSADDHVISLIDGIGYDVTGVVETDDYREMTASDVAIASDWSFSKTQALSLGECRFCEEPILI